MSRVIKRQEKDAGKIQSVRHSARQESRERVPHVDFHPAKESPHFTFPFISRGTVPCLQCKDDLCPREPGF